VGNIPLDESTEKVSETKGEKDKHNFFRFLGFSNKFTEGTDRTEDNSVTKEQETENVIIKFLRLNKVFRIPALSVFVLFLLATFGGLIYLCWNLWIPSLWEWGFEPTTWRSIFSVLGAFYLVIIPFIPFTFFPIIGEIINLYLIEQEEIIADKFSELDRGQQSIETELGENDKTGLIPLIRYSRLKHEAYYSNCHVQTQSSIIYSIKAMWIGFIVIISGVGINFLPISIRDHFSVSNVQEISIAGGTVIEIISALFLWVYRSSIKQLTYFYNRQMDNHNVLICQRIAETMGEDKSDEAKKVIIEKILERGQKAETTGISIPGISKMAKSQ
jgi:hypothetical protein